MAEVGIGISAMVAIGSKFVERSKFTSRHDAIYDKEESKSIKLGERFDNIPQEDVDHFEFEEYTMLRSQSLEDLRRYRDAQEEYKTKEWFKNPWEKYQSRESVRKAKRRVQYSATNEGRHVNDLETYSRSNSRCSSVGSIGAGSESGLGLERSRPYRTDSCSIRARGGSPPSASLEDISRDEKMGTLSGQVSGWLSSLEGDGNADSQAEAELVPPMDAFQREEARLAWEVRFEAKRQRERAELARLEAWQEAQLKELRNNFSYDLLHRQPPDM